MSYIHSVNTISFLINSPEKELHVLHQISVLYCPKAVSSNLLMSFHICAECSLIVGGGSGEGCVHLPGASALAVITVFSYWHSSLCSVSNFFVTASVYWCLLFCLCWLQGRIDTTVTHIPSSGTKWYHGIVWKVSQLNSVCQLHFLRRFFFLEDIFSIAFPN